MKASFNKIAKAIHAIYPTVKVDEFRECIRLTGELDSWDDIVHVGQMAVKAKSLGVINDVKLKDFSELPRKPIIRDDKLDGKRPQILVIGGGVVGCAIARELSRYDVSVMLVEKENDVALAQSSRNDGDIHVGIDLKPGQLKHYYNSRGNAMFERLSDELGVEFQRTGHLIVFSRNYEKLFIPFLKSRAKKLNIEGVRYVKGKELVQIEPGVPSWNKGALYMPSGGEICPYAFTIALAESAVSNGVDLELNTMVEGMTLLNGKIHGVKTNRGTVYPQIVINCAGVYSDVIAGYAGDRTFTVHPRKGSVLILDKKKGGLASTSMNKSPLAKDKGFRSKHTKGGGIVHTVDGNVLVGPSAEEQPYREDYSTNSEMLNNVFKKQKEISENMEKSDIITYFSGIRASNYEEDFVVRKGIFTKNIIEAGCIQSPGLTSAPAIAVDVSEWAIEMLGGAKENFSFNPFRKVSPKPLKMTNEQRDELIRSNPEYGIIVCRCEEISKGEIIDALSSPIPVNTVDGVKRRCRAGMGRCQGGFCSPQVAKIIAEFQGIAIEKVQKSSTNSPIVFGDVKGDKA